MSMRTDIIYGYGFSPAKADDRAILSYIVTKQDLLSLDEQKEAAKKLAAYLAEDKPVDLEDPAEELDDILYDLVEDQTEYNYGCEKTAVLKTIAAIMENETGIRFDYQDGYGHESYIMLVENMPWHMNAAEKNLTEERLYGIMKNYAEQLGLKDEKPGYVQVEYFG